MSTATATRPPEHAASATGGGTLAGTGTLIRFILRRDRIKLPAWLLGISLLVYYYGAALPTVYETDQQIQGAGQFMEGPVGALLAGPGYGRDQLSSDHLAIFVVGVYALYFLLAAALMNILLVARHTRVEEQTGRSELIRANVVGRHAQLTAVMIVAVGANLLLALLVGGAMAGSFAGGGWLLLGASVGAAGLVFAAVTAVTVQVTEYSRAASGLAGAALGVAYLIRAAGDMLSEHGSLLSWFSPLAWSQQTRSYVDGRWWPLALSVAFAAGVAAVGYVLSTRRDVGGALAAARPGAGRAAPWLRSPLALAFRLQRASLIGWGVALAIAGALFGALTQTMADTYSDMSQDMIDVLGGDASSLIDGYLSVMALFMALLAGVFVILGMQAVRSEETRGRVEPVLATATGRGSWLGTHLVVLAAGAVGLLLVAGLATGAGAAAAVGDAAYVWELAWAHLAYVPAVLLLLAVAALLFGVAPRAVPATWALLGYGMLLGFFGPLMDLPQWAHDLSPFEHVARYPQESMAWTPLAVLAVVAGAVAAVALAAFRRRDLDTK